MLFSPEIFVRFLNKSQKIYVFRQHARKFNAGLWNLFQNRPKLGSFVLFSKKFLKFSRKFPKQLFVVKRRENLTRGFEIILKIDQRNAFLCCFQTNLWKFSQKFPTQLCFSSKPRKFNASFSNFFEKSPKIIHFCNFLEKFFQNFQNFQASGRLRSRTP